MEEEQSEKHITKIAETSPEYNSYRESRNQAGELMVEPFGANIARHVNIIHSIPDQLRPKSKQTHQRNLNQARMELHNMAGEPRFQSYLLLLLFILESRSDFPSFVTEASKPSSNLQGIFTVKRMPNKTLEKMITNHVNNFEELRQKFSGMVENYQTTFQQKLINKVRSGEYPIPEDLIRNRVQNTKIALGDALRRELTEDKGGFFNADSEITVIAAQELTKWEEIYTHEMFHALSGRTLIASKLNPSEYLGYAEFIDADKVANYKTQRIGLQIYQRFRWLNEAVTESLTQELVEDASKGAYNSGRRLFQLLQRQGSSPIDKKLFFGVYFENYDPNLPYGKRIPEWKKLYTAINETYSPGFLVKLDNFVKEQGVGKAVEVMKSDWKEILK